MIEEGRTRVIIEDVTPRVDNGEFPVKRITGDAVVVEADVFTDGHDAISAALFYRVEPDGAWIEVAMEPLVGAHQSGDRWRAMFQVREVGLYAFKVCGWVDHFKTWVRDLKKRVDAGQDVSVDLIIGADMIVAAATKAPEREASWHEIFAQSVREGGSVGLERAFSAELAGLMRRNAERRYACMSEPLKIVVDRERARFSAWYELFPRSTSPEPGRHGTFRDVINRLPYVASMRFDVLYLPPIHPIGRAFRKGPNNSVTSGPDDPGSPWAIGAAAGSLEPGAPEEGGHKDIHPELGGLDDFRALVRAAASHGMELAMDIAFQCSPDHPYVKSHPDWFKRRPDGTIQYAENPPKKYQDIYPFDFETADWRGLWDELKSVFEFWIAQGVRIFRVDNPHTKAFPFWQWVIGEIKRESPDVIFLAEAFTRPKVMQRLAKLGFTQSYNYFPWRNTKWELTQYLTELTQGDRPGTGVKEYMGPNLWPNTPDILTEYLQYGGRAAHIARLVLAATLGPSYGIYGPVFELCENRPVAPGKEEYLDSEKYQIRHWDLAQAPESGVGSLRGLIARVNEIRHDNPAFRANFDLRFHEVDNPQIIAYSKKSVDGANEVLVVVNLDPHYKQSGFITLPLEELGLSPWQPYQAHDLLTDARYLWQGERNYVELDPAGVPAHIFALRRKVRTEHDFDYYL
jgi:starch synthase (maltosyl-transferring)